jgi:hypothetical protein
MTPALQKPFRTAKSRQISYNVMSLNIPTLFYSFHTLFLNWTRLDLFDVAVGFTKDIFTHEIHFL